jgi:long-chain acyl-CoA synthetase
MSEPTLVHIFFRRVKEYGDQAALRYKEGGAWRDISWREYGERVRRFAKGLIRLGFQMPEKASEPALRHSLALLGFNRAEWLIADIAALAAGGITAPIYTTSTPEQCEYIINHSESTFVVVENQMQLGKILKGRDSMARIKKIIVMDNSAEGTSDIVMNFDEVLKLGNDPSLDGELDCRMAGSHPEHLATLVYTSGTTGPPKAVMLSHHNITWTADSLGKVNPVGKGDILLSYLPLSHIAEHTLSVFGSIYHGYAVAFAESLEPATLARNLSEIQPTFFFAVPRIWEKFYAAIQEKAKAGSPLKRKIGAWARRVGAQAWALKVDEKPLPLGTGLQFSLARRLVYSKVRAALGLGRAKFLISGAAPIAREVLEFFFSLDMPIQEVYGQSEDCGPTSFNAPGEIRVGSVGKPIPGVQVRIAEDGEICVKGGNVFMGYLKQKAATDEVLVDDWLQSGDVGKLDEDGFLFITDRKKDLLITAGGKNVGPQNIENLLKTIPIISQACVIGDKRKYLTALLTLDAPAAEAWASQSGVAFKDLANLAASSKLRAVIEREIEGKNRELARYEQIKKFSVLPQDFSIDTGELTPTLKMKRKVVNEKYKDVIESMYEEA